MNTMTKVFRGRSIGIIIILVISTLSVTLWNIGAEKDTTVLAVSTMERGNNSIIVNQNGPELSIPERIMPEDDTVDVPISFTSSGNEISVLTFRVSYDTEFFSLDETDNDNDGIPDAVGFSVPDSFTPTVPSYDIANGEVNFYIADTFPPIASLPDGAVATITLQVSPDVTEEQEYPIEIASVGEGNAFATKDGESLAGTLQDGSVYISKKDEPPEPVDVALSGVEIDGTTTGTKDTPYSFTARTSPGNATPPIVYTWSPEPEQGQGTDTAEYRWDTDGDYTISVEATNLDGEAVVEDEHQITIEEKGGGNDDIDPENPSKLKVFMEDKEFQLCVNGFSTQYIQVQVLNKDETPLSNQDVIFSSTAPGKFYAPAGMQGVLKQGLIDRDGKQVTTMLSQVILSQNLEPGLEVSDNIAPSEDGTVEVPITFTAGDYEIGAVTFLVDYDEQVLRLDDQDGDGDGVPDSISFTVPGSFQGSIPKIDVDNGSFGVLIADLTPPISSLVDDTIMRITFNVIDMEPEEDVYAEIGVSPPAEGNAFGTTTGGSVAGVLQSGSVDIPKKDEPVDPVDVALSGVDIDGIPTGESEKSYSFTAITSPDDATLPIVFTWSPEPEQGQGTDTAEYRWDADGDYTISVEATNLDGEAVVEDEHSVTIESGGYEPQPGDVIITTDENGYATAVFGPASEPGLANITLRSGDVSVRFDMDIVSCMVCLPHITR